MSLFVDEKYARLVSPRLEGFEPSGGKHKYRFRCPFCGDSKKSKSKRRGNLYPKNNDLNFGCWNCGRSTTFQKFLEHVDPNLAREYTLERYTSGELGTYNYKQPKKEELAIERRGRVTAFDKNDEFLDPLPTIASLPDDHYAKQYIAKRQIPEEFWSTLYYTDDFKSVVDAATPDHEFKLKPNESRIILPFKDKKRRVIAFQGRSLSKGGLRYITVKIDKNSPKVYGLDRLDVTNRIYLLEGPFDSMFLPNAIAAAGSDVPKLDALRDKLTIVYDNEPRNLQIVTKMEKAITLDYTVCIWPESIEQKDVNDMILAGKSKELVKSIIDRSSMAGMQAMLMLNRWRRC